MTMTIESKFAAALAGHSDTACPPADPTGDFRWKQARDVSARDVLDLEDDAVADIGAEAHEHFKDTYMVAESVSFEGRGQVRISFHEGSVHRFPSLHWVRVREFVHPDHGR